MSSVETLLWAAKYLEDQERERDLLAEKQKQQQQQPLHSDQVSNANGGISASGSSSSSSSSIGGSPPGSPTGSGQHYVRSPGSEYTVAAPGTPAGAGASKVSTAIGELLDSLWNSFTHFPSFTTLPKKHKVLNHISLHP